VDDSRPINYFACLVVVIEGSAHEVDALREELAWTVAEDKVVLQGHGARERKAIQALTLNVPSSCTQS
jgi:hypothetical protein